MSEIEVKDTEAGIRKFVPIAKKYGIDFAIRKVKPLSNSENADSAAKQAAEGEPEAQKFNYLIFFKGADEETVLRAFQEYNDKYDPKKSHERNEQETPKSEKSQPTRDGKAQPQKPAQKQSKAKPQARKRTKSRAREKRPSLLKRLEQKKREVDDHRREIQRAPQELSR